MNDECTHGEYPQDRCVFVLGCDRSGTTLLQNMLNAHSRMSVTYEQGVLNPYDTAFFDAGLDAVVELAQKRGLSGNYDGILSGGAFSERADESAFATLMASLYRSHAAAEEKQLWGDKRPQYTGQVPRLSRLFPNAIFIHIVRDPRGVALSWEKTTWGPQTAYQAAVVWARRVREARIALEALDPRRSATVKFEDLVTGSEITLQRICDAIGVPFERQMLDKNRRSRQKLSERQERLHPLRSRAPQVNVAEKWRNEAGRVIRHIEAACFDEMQHWGYTPLYASGGTVPVIWRSYYRVLGKLRNSRRRKSVRRSKAAR